MLSQSHDLLLELPREHELLLLHSLLKHHLELFFILLGLGAQLVLLLRV